MRPAGTPRHPAHANPGQALAPDLFPRGGIRLWKIDDEPQPPQEGRIEVLAQIRRQDSEARICLHALQQKCDLDIRVTVMSVLDFTAPAEQGISLVDEKCGAGLFSIGEDPVDVLLGIADIFADDSGQVDAEDLNASRSAIPSAAIVLPVPLGPWNSAVTPRP